MSGLDHVPPGKPRPISVDSLSDVARKCIHGLRQAFYLDELILDLESLVHETYERRECSGSTSPMRALHGIMGVMFDPVLRALRCFLSL